MMESMPSDIHVWGNKENAFRQNINDLQHFIDHIAAAIYACDQHGHLTYFNRAAAELWGREPELGKDLWCGSWKIYKTDGVTQLPAAECPMAILLKEGCSAADNEMIIERPDGNRRYVMANPRQLITDGKVAGAIDMLIDITEQKMAEVSKARLAAIVESSDDAIVSKSLEGVVISWNKAAEKIFGYTAAEMRGQSINKIIPPDRLAEEPIILKRIGNGEYVEHFETKRMTKDGRLIDVALTISPVRDNNGNIIGASKIARDITYHKKAEKLIQESEERFRTIADNAPVMIWIDDAEKKCIYLSKEWLNFTGFDTALQLGHKWKQCIHPDDLEMRDTIYNKAFDAREEYHVEYRLRRHDGQYRWISGKGVPWYSADGNFCGYIGCSTDIHEQKMAKDELEKTVKERTLELTAINERLEKSNKELEQFAFITSHDLQEPLRKIQTFVNMLYIKENLIISDEARIYIDKIGQSSKRMSKLINGLLQLSRLDYQEEKLKKIDLNEVIMNVKDDFELLIKNKDAEIYSDDLPEIECIPIQMHQLFFNLIGNALKFTVAGRKPVINITYHLLSGVEKQNYDGLSQALAYCQISIRDNGIGFAQVYAQKIFEIFQRLNDRTAYEGTGIGLSLCYKIVSNHHGLIFANGTPGQGAIFNIILPVCQS